MAEKNSMAITDNVIDAIILIRGHRVILGNDLALLFGVTTRRLNEQVRRNIDRFPKDFMFQLTQKEKDGVVANCDHLSNLRFTQNLPFAFTEHGTIMLANVLNSPEAVKTSIEVVRAFIRLRLALASNADLARKVDELEEKYDYQFKAVFDALRQLMAPPEPRKNQVGFHWDAKEKPGKEKAAGKLKRHSGRKSRQRPGTGSSPK